MTKHDKHKDSDAHFMQPAITSPDEYLTN